MWSFLHLWVRQLVLIVVLAGFIDMLLPSGQMRRFAQVVVGLFIIMALLNPLLLLFQPDLTWQLAEPDLDAAAWSESSGTGNGEVLTAKVEEQVFQHYQRRLEEQVEALILSTGVVKRAQAKVSVEAEAGHPNLGGILGMEVWVGRGEEEKEEVRLVDKIEVRVNSGKDERRWDYPEGRAKVSADLAEEITAVLTAFFSIEPRIISIYALEGEGF